MSLSAETIKQMEATKEDSAEIRKNISANILTLDINISILQMIKLRLKNGTKNGVNMS